MAIAFRVDRADHSSNPFWTGYAQTATADEAAAAVHRASEAVADAQAALYLVKLQAVRALSDQHKSVREIAKIIGWSKSSVARELKGSTPDAVAHTGDVARNERVARMVASAWGSGFPRRIPEPFPSGPESPTGTSNGRSELPR
ncbi:hypothetical protein [Microbacterium sp. BF1]|uniref:hypothetical protein n=1 Tax=Microbacterium sp. BF1 TaxID=2821146 RepID=UPI001C4E0DE6|nr:hypothetical protein [Microbacterium sp. BF1]